MAEEVTKLTDLLTQSSPEDVVKLMREIDKYSALIDKISGFIARLNKMGILPAVIRVLGVKLNVPDIDKPLADPLAVHASSALHKVLFDELNQYDEQTIKQMIDQALYLKRISEEEESDEEKKE